MIVFPGRFGQSVGQSLISRDGNELGLVTFSRFANGEARVTLASDVSGKECTVVQSMAPKPDEALVELLLVIDALKENGAQKISLCVPYLGYSLMNRHFDGEPVSARAVARAISSGGPDEVSVVDVHAEHVLQFFDVPVRTISPISLFGSWLTGQSLGPCVVVAPDDGAQARAREVAEALGASHVVARKVRNDKTTEIVDFTLDLDAGVETAVVVDDMVNTGGTTTRVANVLRERGVKRIVFCATHFLGVAGSLEKVAGAVDQFVTTNSIDHGLVDSERVAVLDLQAVL